MPTPNQTSYHTCIRHRHKPTQSLGKKKTSTGPHGNRFLMFLGLSASKKAMMHKQRWVDRAHEVFQERQDIQAYAIKHMSPEWQWQPREEKDPFEPMPQSLRRFMWEAKQRRQFSDRRAPWLEEMLGEHIEDRDDCAFRAFPDQPRAQEYTNPEAYTTPTRAQLLRKRTPEEIEAMCRPADTYYSKRAASA
eukprot:TRINITY_DN251_c9_g1_i1.p1 TRINITY_DN251_c9_g1~~TRINITY_DN251_c9_g1_i1.p1  ORF type:complete len:219 (+),score=69.42 TRINITY_DN251_c9_g1_i1:87-659(+)